jgi:hypothetical protein
MRPPAHMQGQHLIKKPKSNKLRGSHRESIFLYWMQNEDSVGPICRCRLTYAGQKWDGKSRDLHKVLPRPVGHDPGTWGRPRPSKRAFVGRKRTDGRPRYEENRPVGPQNLHKVLPRPVGDHPATWGRPRPSKRAFVGRKRTDGSRDMRKTGLLAPKTFTRFYQGPSETIRPPGGGRDLRNELLLAENGPTEAEI